MDAREVDSNAVPFSGPLPRSNLNQKLALRLALRMGALHPRSRFPRIANLQRLLILFRGGRNPRVLMPILVLWLTRSRACRQR